MRYLLVLLSVSVALVGAGLPSLSVHRDEHVLNILENENEIEIINNPEITPRFILSWQIRRFLRKLQKQMPCGFPEYGVPPLAPLKTHQFDLNIKRGPFETDQHFNRLRIDGLDKFLIKRFKLNMFTSKVHFDFLFPKIKISANEYQTKNLIDALEYLGIFVQLENAGHIDLLIKNVRLSGALEYNMPILWGSIKVKSLRTEVNIEQCSSKITGLLGNGSANDFVNQQIEKFAVIAVNTNTETISDLLESILVPRANKFLKGNNLRTIINWILNWISGENENDPIVTDCVAPEDPWA